MRLYHGSDKRQEHFKEMGKFELGKRPYLPKKPLWIVQSLPNILRILRICPDVMYFPPKTGQKSAYFVNLGEERDFRKEICLQIAHKLLPHSSSQWPKTCSFSAYK